MPRIFFCILLITTAWGCANIVPPSGGERDTRPPVLLSVTPADSQRSVRTTKIVLRFDEYVTLADASAIQISPLLGQPLRVSAGLKSVTVQIPDSLLKASTTYTLTFGNSIRDLHEGNPYTGYTYRFSTGSFFDSLRLEGNVVNAATGAADTGSRILLYEDSPTGDSVVVQGPPLYTTTTDGLGHYVLQGLPSRTFRIYAHRESNGNLTYDDPAESIAFLPVTVRPGISDTLLPVLRLFKRAGGDSAAQDVPFRSAGKNGRAPGTGAQRAGYAVLVDTSANARSQDLQAPLLINMGTAAGSINPGRIFLTTDSAGITTEAPFTATLDTTDRKRLLLSVPWRGDAAYTLRLQKGFATDSTGADLLPGRYPFRTRREEDYGTLRVDVPGRFYGRGYVLQITNATTGDTLHAAPLEDSSVIIRRVKPGNFRLLIIQDDNRNGHWDTGDLLSGQQPEIVYPHAVVVALKAGWEVSEDFRPANDASAGEALPAGKR